MLYKTRKELPRQFLFFFSFNIVVRRTAQLREKIRNMSETDRRCGRSGRSNAINAEQSGASGAGSDKRCQCKSNVDDWVITIEGWPQREDVRLCPKHMAELARSIYVTLEANEQVANRVALEEEAATALRQHRARALTAHRAHRASSSRPTRHLDHRGLFPWFSTRLCRVKDRLLSNLPIQLRVRR